MRVLKEWQFARKLSVDLLKGLSESQLLYTPEPEMGVFWKQFRHIGRVEENYRQALFNFKIDFNERNSKYSGGASVEALVNYLSKQDELLASAVNSFDQARTIDWFGEKVDLETHLIRLISHETLHHGQWIIYAKASGINFPESWKAWGL